MNAISKRILTGITALLLMITALPVFGVSAHASEESGRTVRAGFFAYPGYHEFDGSVRSGYGEDFLRLLRRYTGFRYEYVGYDKSWEEMQRMLLAGEIDLVTSARKTQAREQMFDFSEPIGESYAQINVRADDERFIPGDHAALDGITIGLIAGNSRNSDLERFALEKGFTYRTLEYATAEALGRALKNEKVDAVCASSLRKTENEKTVAEFAPESFYVIVKKGNTELLNEINYGIAQMDINEGNWRDDLYYKNYRETAATMLFFTQREKEYIRAVQNGEKTVTAIARPDRDPYSFVENGELTGIVPDYFAHLMEMAGLSWTCLAAKDGDEFMQWANGNCADVIMDCRYSSAPSPGQDFGILTDPYMQITVSRVTRRGFSGAAKTVAEVDGREREYADAAVAENAVYIPAASTAEAMKAVKDGKADVCYAYSYTAEKYINADPDNSLQATLLGYPVYDMQICVSPYTDHELCSILNKCIKADVKGTADEYVRKYTAAPQMDLSLGQYLKRNPTAAFIAAAMFALLVGLVAVFTIRDRTSKMKAAELESEIARRKRIEEREESRKIMESVTSRYNISYMVNMADDSFELLRMDRDVIGYGESFACFSEAKAFFLGILPERDREIMEKELDYGRIRERLRQKESYTVEYRVPINGAMIWHEMNVTAMDGDRVTIGFVKKDLKITRRHLTDREYNDYFALYEVDIATQTAKIVIDSPYYGIDRSGTAVPYADAMKAFAAGLEGEARDFFLSIADIDRIKEILSAEDRYTYTYRSNNVGENGWVDCRGYITLRNDDGSPAMFTLGFRHIDALGAARMELQHRLNEKQEELEEALEMAESANRAKSAFLFNMSHDIRTPMNAILGYTDIALNHIGEPEKVGDSLKKIKTSGNHLLSLINDILEMSRIEAGRTEIAEVPLNILEASENVINMSRALAATKDIEFTASVGELKNPYVYADELHTNQVIINIISNAIKYTAPGGRVEYRIEQTREPSGGVAGYRFSVRDNGIGMSEEFQKHLFESFAREKTSTVSGQEGAGLGLAIVKRITDLMGGTIDVESRQGEGSAFIVELPMRVMDGAAVEAFRAARAGNSANAGELSLEGRKVLVVEDNEMNREIAVEILEESGLKTDTARDGAEALEKVRENGAEYYDAVLMDIQMPVMNGYEATAAIRKLPGGAALPIIALSANAFDEDRQKSLNAGMNAHIAKPIDVKTLMDTLSLLIHLGGLS